MMSDTLCLSLNDVLGRKETTKDEQLNHRRGLGLWGLDPQRQS
jgi:hypothetical protein